jgi:toxin CptA
MHSAPAVSYPVGRSRFSGWLVALTALGGVIVGLLWGAAADSVGWRQWLFAMTLLVSCSLAGDAWWRTPLGRLRWDGQAWGWQTVNVRTSGVLSVHLDFQFVLLVSLRTGPGARIWLWPERRAESALWDALRRAIFSRSGGASPVPDANAQDEYAQVKS